MALKMDIVTEYGLNVIDSYTRIDYLNGNKAELCIALNYYLNQSACEDGSAPMKRSFFSFTPSVEEKSLNFIKQGYEYLKTLPEFANAVDA